MMKGTDTVMDLETLRHSVENDIKNYRYSSSGNTVGTAWSEERIEAELAAMRAALVSPYWADVELRDTHEQIATDPAILRKCATSPMISRERSWRLTRSKTVFCSP
jgi:hypothetical protein